MIFVSVVMPTTLILRNLVVFNARLRVRHGLTTRRRLPMEFISARRTEADSGHAVDADDPPPAASGRAERPNRGPHHIPIADTRIAGRRPGRVGVALNGQFLRGKLGRAIQICRADSFIRADGHHFLDTCIQAASTTFAVPMILVLIASIGLYSQAEPASTPRHGRQYPRRAWHG